MLKQPKQTTRRGAGQPQTLYLLTDLRGTIISVSPPLLITTGKSPQELIDQPLSKLLAPSTTHNLQAILNATELQQLRVLLTVQGIRTSTTIEFSVTRTDNHQSAVLEWRADCFDEATHFPAISDQHAEALFRQFADTAPGMIWISDEQDNTVFFNKSWLQFTGITVDDVAGDGWTRLIHPDDIPVAISAYRKYFRERQPATLEYRIKTNGDQYRWVIDQSAPRYHADGRFLGFVGSVMDIHDRKLAEDTIRRQAKVMHDVSDAIISTDIEYRITTFNHAAEKIYGLKATDLFGKHIRSVINHEYVSTTPQEVHASLNETGGWEGMVWYDHPEGRRVYMLATLTVLRNEQGERIGIAAIHRDITDKRRAEETLRITEERYRSLVFALGEGVIMCNKEGEIIACNESAEQILDIPKGELTGRSIYQPYTKFFLEEGDVVDAKDSPAVRTLKTGESYKEVILGFSKRDSMLSWISVNTEPVYYSTPAVVSEPDAVVTTIVDITDRKNHEQLLALEKKVLEMNALPAISIKTIIDYFLEGLEKLFPGMLCTVLTLDHQKQTVHPLSAPSLPVEYSQAINGKPIGPEDGSCGTAMFRKEKVISTDVATDPLWDKYRYLADQFGIGACWSFPILDSHKEVLATIATYYHFPKVPGPKDLGILDRACDLLRVIIENKDAERKIRRNHERYLLVTKATNDAIWDWDINSSDLYWGDGYFTLFGYKPGYITDGIKKWEDYIHPEDRDRVKNNLDKYLNNSNARLWEAEYRFQKANGEYALVQDRGFFIFDHEGKMSRMVGSVQDITEKREMEKKLLETELNKQKLVAQAVVNAQEKDRAEIGKDLHDNVNQILTTAKLYLELALVEESERVRLINRCTSSISDAINEVRAISRSLVPASIGDLGLIESILDLTENVRATRKLKMHFNYDADIDELLDDKRKLTLFRVIQEQVNNVLKHSGAANLMIELRNEKQWIGLSISDDGIGFDQTTVRARKGNGLSNIISRADLFNGVVKIDTAPGKGCRLTVHVPIANL
jgi:PAS domain S-box-containing protein